MGEIRYIIIVVMCLTLPLCGVFTPRDDFEEPLNDKTADDYFNFQHLMTGTGEEFTKLDLYELFDEHFKYTNIRLANIDYMKSEMINFLSQQHERFPEYKVSWEKKDKPLRNIDTITMNNVWYTITEPEHSDSVLYSGNCGFIIVRDLSSVWRLIRWTDEPADQSFFSAEN